MKTLQSSRLGIGFILALATLFMTLGVNIIAAEAARYQYLGVGNGVYVYGCRGQQIGQTSYDAKYRFYNGKNSSVRVTAKGLKYHQMRGYSYAYSEDTAALRGSFRMKVYRGAGVGTYWISMTGMRSC